MPEEESGSLKGCLTMWGIGMLVAPFIIAIGLPMLLIIALLVATFGGPILVWFAIWGMPDEE